MSLMILEGDQYRLVSPYEGNHCAINYVSKDKQRAVLFAYDLHPRYKEPVMNVKMQGLDADKVYTVKETNLMPGKESDLECNGKQYSGDYLMKVGLKCIQPDRWNQPCIGIRITYQLFIIKRKAAKSINRLAAFLGFLYFLSLMILLV